MPFVALALLTALSTSASPPPTPRRISALVIPMDQAAEAISLQYESHMNEAIGEHLELELKKTELLFGIAETAAAETALKNAQESYRQGREAFEAGKLDEAEAKLRASLAEFRKAAPAMDACDSYCDGLVMYAAIMLERGDAPEAKLLLLDVLSLASSLELHPKRFKKELIALRNSLLANRSAKQRGNALISSKPAGARVYLDGELVGYSPVTIPMALVGKHLLTIERPGFERWGQWLDIEIDDQELKYELVPTPAYLAYERLLDRAAAEVADTKATSAPTLKALGARLGLDRAVIAVLRNVVESRAIDMNVGIFDLRSGKRLSSRRVQFQSDEYGQLKAEVGKVVNLLLTHANGEKIVKSDDPLDTKGGTEDWNAEPRSNAPGTRKKVAVDPLDNVSGTEDW
jgi:hypothetical protein